MKLVELTIQIYYVLCILYYTVHTIANSIKTIIYWCRRAMLCLHGPCTCQCQWWSMRSWLRQSILRSFLGILKSSSIFMILFQYSFNFLVVMIFHCYYAPHHLECISRKQNRDFELKYVGWCDMRTHPCNAFFLL